MQFWQSPFDREQSRAWVARSMAAYDSGLGRLAVVMKENGLLVGDCGLMRTPVNGVSEVDLGYILFRDHWGKGRAIEAARACLVFALDVLKRRRIVASMETKHVASRRGAEKIGMTLESEFSNWKNRNVATLLFAVNGRESHCSA